MSRTNNDSAPRRKVLLHVTSFRAEAERSEASPVAGALSPMSGGIVTPRRIVRTLHMSPAVTQLVQLDGVSPRPLSTTSSVSAMSEDVVDDLVSEAISATCESGGKLPALGMHNQPDCGITTSCRPDTGKSATATVTATRLTTDGSARSLSSLSPTSSESSSSNEYTETFDMESLPSCSLTCIGEAKLGAVGTSRHTPAPAPSSSIAVTAAAITSVAISPPRAGSVRVAESPPRGPESCLVHVLGSRRVSNTDGSESLKKIINVRREERIGRGSFGDVFRAVDLDTGLPLAVKEILVAADSGRNVEKQIRALEREIRVMRKLHHEHIVNYYSARREDGCSALHIYMEYIGGGTIAQKLKANGPFSEDVARRYTQQLLQGLVYLHQRRIVHRDLKGDNLFLTEDDVLKVGDFGTSKELQTTLVTNSVAGTPNFMAPEVIACSGHTCMADIWSVGCCVLEMLTGHPPFWNLDNHMAVMFAIMKGKVEAQVPPHISEGAKDFIRQCTCNNPNERPAAWQLLQHPWLEVREADDAEDTRLQSCLSLSSASAAQEETNSSNEGLKCEVRPPSVNDAFQKSATAVVAIISERPKVGNNCLLEVSRRSTLPDASQHLPSVAAPRQPASAKPPPPQPTNRNASPPHKMPVPTTPPCGTQVSPRMGINVRRVLARSNNRNVGAGVTGNRVRPKVGAAAAVAGSRSGSRSASERQRSTPRTGATVCSTR